LPSTGACSSPSPSAAQPATAADRCGRRTPDCIRDADFDRVVGHLAATLTSFGVAGPTIGMIADILGPLREQIVDERAEAAALG
jgi:hypothetical protein